MYNMYVFAACASEPVLCELKIQPELYPAEKGENMLRNATVQIRLLRDATARESRLECVPSTGGRHEGNRLRVRHPP
jgi:hypothetical protein